MASRNNLSLCVFPMATNLTAPRTLTVAPQVQGVMVVLVVVEEVLEEIVRGEVIKAVKGDSEGEMPQTTLNPSKDTDLVSANFYNC